VVYSANGNENLNDSDDEESIYILSDFEGETFQRLCSCYCRIVAPPVIIWAATRDEVCKLVELLSYLMSQIELFMKMNIKKIKINNMPFISKLLSIYLILCITVSLLSL